MSDTKKFIYSILTNEDRSTPKGYSPEDWGAATRAEVDFEFFPASIHTAQTSYKVNVKLKEAKKQEIINQGIEVLSDQDASTVIYDLSYIPDHIDVNQVPLTYLTDKIYFVNADNTLDTSKFEAAAPEDINSLLLNIIQLENLANKLESILLEESQS